MEFTLEEIEAIIEKHQEWVQQDIDDQPYSTDLIGQRYALRNLRHDFVRLAEKKIKA
jgi:predicted metal-dependent hydrolase